MIECLKIEDFCNYANVPTVYAKFVTGRISGIGIL